MTGFDANVCQAKPGEIDLLYQTKEDQTERERVPFLAWALVV